MSTTRPASRTINRYVAAGALVLTVAACDDATEPATASQPTSSSSSQAQTTVDAEPTEPTVPSTTGTTAAATTAVATTPADDEAGIDAAELAGLQFMEARANHDAELLVAIMAPDASFGGSELAQRVDDYALLTRYEQIVDWQFLDVSCNAGSADRVVCSYTLQDAFNEHAGQGPYPGSSFLLELDGNQIIRANHNVDAPDEFFAATEVGFFAWVRDNHPDDLDVMVDDRFLGIAPVSLTVESIDLWDEHVNSFLDSDE